MLISINDTHEVLCNRESGYGRYDVMIIYRDISKLGIVFKGKDIYIKENENIKVF